MKKFFGTKERVFMHFSHALVLMELARKDEREKTLKEMFKVNKEYELRFAKQLQNKK